MSIKVNIHSFEIIILFPVFLVLKLLIPCVSGTILYYGFYFFGDLEYSHFSTVVFSALVLTELLNILSVVQKLTWVMVIGEVSSFTVIEHE